MARLTKDAMFQTLRPVAETNLDKTTRVVREITESEAEKRQTKMARLRTLRFEREANTPAEPVAVTAVKASRKVPEKAKT